MATQLTLTADAAEVEEQEGVMAKAFRATIWLRAPGLQGSAVLWQSNQVLNDEVACEREAIDHLCKNLKSLLNGSIPERIG